MGLRKLIADLVYEADWEIKGTLNPRVYDITGHRMVDEIEVVDEVIDAVIGDFRTWLDDLPEYVEERRLAKETVRVHIMEYIHSLER